MEIPTRIRRAMLGIASLFTLAAAIWVSDEPPYAGNDIEVVSANERLQADKGPSSTSSETVQLINNINRPDPFREKHGKAFHNLFAGTSWAPPTPVIAMPQPVEEPPMPPPIEIEPAPTLPYRYLGRIQEGDGDWRIFLLKDNSIHTVRVGDVLDDAYRVEKIDAQGISIIYMPLNLTMLIAIEGRT